MKEKKVKQNQLNAFVVFYITAAINPDVNVEKFLLESNEYMGEPKNADGCIISMIPKEIDYRGKKKTDKLDRYIHFSYHGTKFCIDREDMSASCDKIAKFDEMCGNKPENGMYKLNVETSN